MVNRIKLFVILFFLLCWLSCGQYPSEAPPVLTGLLKISATVDSVAVDSMIVVLDDLPIGIRANPFVLPGVLSGTHQVDIIKMDSTDPINFSTIPQLVFVPPHDTARVKFILTNWPNVLYKNFNSHCLFTLVYFCQTTILSNRMSHGRNLGAF